MNKKILKSLLIISLANLLSPSLLAGTMGSMPDTWIPVSTFSAGAIWTNQDKTQTLFLTPEIEKTYVADHSTRALFNGEFFLGGQKNLCEILQGQLGLAISATSKSSPSGIIWDDGDPLFANYVYSYKTQHSRIAAKGKLLLNKDYWAMPWVSASLGVSFNRNQKFNSWPIIFETLPTPNFTSHTHTAFSYTAGAGLQKAMSPHWQLGVGYEFTDFGKNRLNQVFGQTEGYGLSFNHMYANGVMASLTFVA